MPREIRFLNTMTRRVEVFHPLETGHVRMYNCGPTVYNFVHIGNLRTFLFEDVLRRTLQAFGYRVTQVMNLTDIDDKTIKGAAAEGVSLREFTDRYIAAFFQDIDALRFQRAEHYPRATDFIPQQVELVEKLTERGHTYVQDGSTYFRIATFRDYGKLSGIDVDQVRAGARVDADEYEKEDVRDFVLWKASKPGEPSWETVLGAGRPGWHLECSAMAMALLGESFDIHTGAVDNIFPHHENEIAQSEGATGRPFVHTWLHAEHLIVEGQKMAKSLGNFFTLRDLLERGHDPLAIRYLLISVPYRQKLIHVRWSGEGCWIPLGEFQLGVGYENHTSNPSVGDLLFHPGGFSETEILLAYGGVHFACKMGQLAGNHFLTLTSGLENIYPLGRKSLYEGAMPIRFEIG